MGSPFFVVSQRVNRHIWRMIKYILIALLIGLVGSGIWFWSKSDPQKLDFADRMAPGAVEVAALPVTDIAYGNDARQKLDIYAPTAKAETPRRCSYSFMAVRGAMANVKVTAFWGGLLLRAAL